MKSLIDILKFSTEYLEKKNIKNPRLIAEKIISNVLNLSRLALYMNYDRPLEKNEKEKIKEALIKHGEKKIPLQYIFSEEYFYGYKFYVDNRVLIPRPDTEILVENILKKIENIKEPKILDIGTGSGAIAIAIAKKRSDSLVLGVDISNEALQVAEINKKINEVKNVKFLKSNLFSEVKYNEFDAIVSNPPYISKDEYAKLSDKVKKHEPKLALTDDGDGYYFYKKISKNAKNFLKNSGFLAFEVGYNQAKNVLEIMKSENYSSIEIFKDYNEIERVLIGQKNV